MFDFFYHPEIRYQSVPVKAITRFDSLKRQKMTSADALNKLRAFEDRLQDLELLSNTQRNDHRVKANPKAIASRLDKMINDAAGQASRLTISTKLEEIATMTDDPNGKYHSQFETLYRSNKEDLSDRFNHVTSTSLNQLKESLIKALMEFKHTPDTSPTQLFFHNKSKAQITAFNDLIDQSVDLIYSAKTVSAVIASIAVAADLSAQLELAKSRNIIQRPASLFYYTLPELVKSNLKKMSMGTGLNASGSAFQLEQMRESLVLKLENYLQNRSRIDRYDAKNGTLEKNYTPIDRGMFYNKKLQNERIKVAAQLLSQLEQMQCMDTNQPISSPKDLANLVIESLNLNSKKDKHFANPILDGVGDLHKLLKNTLVEMNEVYTQRISYTNDENFTELKGHLGINDKDEGCFALLFS